MATTNTTARRDVTEILTTDHREMMELIDEAWMLLDREHNRTGTTLAVLISRSAVLLPAPSTGEGSEEGGEPGGRADGAVRARTPDPAVRLRCR